MVHFFSVLVLMLRVLVSCAIGDCWPLAMLDTAVQEDLWRVLEDQLRLIIGGRKENRVNRSAFEEIDK